MTNTNLKALMINSVWTQLTKINHYKILIMPNIHNKETISTRLHVMIPVGSQVLTPHSVVTHIGCVISDQKVPGSNPVWVGCCGVDIYQWCLTGLTRAWWCENCLWLRAPKRPLGVCRKD